MSLEYEHCHDVDPEPDTNCLPLSDTKNFWMTSKVFLQIDYLQLEMKDIDQPL